MEHRIFALALDFMYDGKCAVAASLLEQILTAVSVLQIDSLLAAAVTKLEKHVTADKCASIMVCADCHHLSELQKNRNRRVHFVDVASDPAVPESNMLVLLKCKNLNVNSEQEVFETLATWLKGQAEPPGGGGGTD